MKLRKIDKMKPSKLKLVLWINFGKKHQCLHCMPEIQELYYTLRQREEITKDEFERLMYSNYLEVM